MCISMWGPEVFKALALELQKVGISWRWMLGPLDVLLTSEPSLYFCGGHFE